MRALVVKQRRIIGYRHYQRITRRRLLARYDTLRPRGAWVFRDSSWGCSIFRSFIPSGWLRPRRPKGRPLWRHRMNWPLIRYESGGYSQDHQP
jgi:hypothetical protein